MSSSESEDEERAVDENHLDDHEMTAVLRLKVVGNKRFAANELAPALASWAEAIAVFGTRPGTDLQRAEKSKIHGNVAEAHLRQGDFPQARRAADQSLACDDKNLKARFRRARALIAMGDPASLTLAMDDMRRYQADGGVVSASDAKLLRTGDGGKLLAATRDGMAAAASPPAADQASGTSTVPQPADISDADADAVAKKAEAIRAAQEVVAKTAAAPMASTTSCGPTVRTEWLRELRDPKRDRYAWLIDVYRTRCASPLSRRPAHGRVRAVTPRPILLWS